VGSDVPWELVNIARRLLVMQRSGREKGSSGLRKRGKGNQQNTEGAPTATKGEPGIFSQKGRTNYNRGREVHRAEKGG